MNLTAKICQDNNKALMTNPNKVLGKWLLKEVLRLPARQLVTYEFLRDSGIDSVYVEKIDELNFKIDFASTGKFEEFKETFNNDFEE